MKILLLFFCILSFSCSHGDNKNNDEIANQPEIKASVGADFNLNGSLGSTDALSLTDTSIAYTYSQSVQIELKESLNARLNINNVKTDCASSDIKLATVEIHSETLTIDSRKTNGNFLFMNSLDLGPLARGRNTLNFSVSGSKACTFSLTAIVGAAQ